MHDPNMVIFSTIYQQGWTHVNTARGLQVYNTALVRNGSHTWFSGFRKMTLSSLIKSRQSRWGFSVNPKHPSRSLPETKPCQALLLTRRLTSSLLRWRWPFTFWSPSFSLIGFSCPVMGSFSPVVTVLLCPQSNKPGCERFKYFQSQLSLA